MIRSGGERLGRKSRVTSWHRLDNAANVFPLIAHQTFSNVFRVATELYEPIDAEILQHALDVTLPNFGNFNFRIRRGFFWYYFEPTNARLLVREETLRPCAYIDTKNRHHHLVRVVYYRNRIAVEVFHAITDGTGALNFIKALTENYLRLKKGETLPEAIPRLKIQSELEDSYKKHYKKALKNEKGALGEVSRALRLKGKLLPVNTMGVIHGTVSVDQLLAHSRSIGVTLTEFLVGTYVWAIYHTKQEEGLIKRPINIAVPVNLRKFFESNTNMNFFSHINVTLDATKEPVSHEDVVAIVKKQFREKISKEQMLKNISKDVALRNNPLTRAFPLVMKNIFVRLAYMKNVQAYTSTVSNIGKVEMPELYKEDVKQFELLVNVSAIDPIKCGLCAYENRMVITLTSQLESTEIQKNFFRKLVEQGLHVTIDTNGAYYEIL